MPYLACIRPAYRAPEHPLRACRTAMGLSIDDLTARTRLSPYFLMRVEEGERELTERHARLLAGALNTSHELLMASYAR